MNLNQKLGEFWVEKLHAQRAFHLRIRERVKLEFNQLIITLPSAVICLRRDNKSLKYHKKLVWLSLGHLHFRSTSIFFRCFAR
jgi:hypothetical protein